LEICRQKRAGCQVYAVGDVIVHDKPSAEQDRLIAEYRSKIADQRIEKAFQGYLQDEVGKDYRVLVADRRSGVTMRAEGKRSVKDAITEAKEACVKAETICELYAIGTEPVIGLSDEQTKLIIREYEGRSQPAP
jgi:hypothetical protein